MTMHGFLCLSYHKKSPNTTILTINILNVDQFLECSCAGEPPVPCPLRSFTLALFCSFFSHSRRSRCIRSALQKLYLQTLAQSLRTPFRSARLHSLCSVHSLVIPVEVGAFAVFCRTFFYRPVHFSGTLHEFTKDCVSSFLGTVYTITVCSKLRTP